MIWWMSLALAAESEDSTVASILSSALSSELAYERLRTLCDDYPRRLSGSDGLEDAIDWALAEMQAEGLETWTEPVTVPRWERGEERLSLLSPMERPMALLGLGMTVGTPAGGIEADLVVVGSFEEMEALEPAAIEGKIVLFDVPFTTYGETVQYRLHGASRAAARGAAAVLIRSVAPSGLQTPHTGTLRYDEEQEKIPAAAITLEDATYLHRLFDRGIVPRLKLELGAQHLEPRVSRNLIAEIPGREDPQEVVVLGCHYDAWDVGQGAQDDGAGCMMAWTALTLIGELGLQPRRTLRAVLYTNEENGLGGGKAYVEARSARELRRHVAAIESDLGNGRAPGFRVDLPDSLSAKERMQAEGWLWEMSQQLKPIEGGELRLGHGGADIGPLKGHGVPTLGLDHDASDYWPIHHTRADTFDKIILEDLQHNLALFAAAGWMLAEQEQSPRP